MLPPQQRVIVIGFREESQPKGHGYFFWRLESEKRERRVSDCDLFETSLAVVRPMFSKALDQIMSSLGLPQHQIKGLEMRYENMSALAIDLLAQELQRIDLECAGSTVPAVVGLDSSRLA
jgi:hypothetical protein